MTEHFKMVSKAHVLQKRAPESKIPFTTEGPDNDDRLAYLGGDHERLEVMKLFLHAADLNNPTKSEAVTKLWTERVLQEFFDQGDTEKRLGRL